MRVIHTPYHRTKLQIRASDDPNMLIIEVIDPPTVMSALVSTKALVMAIKEVEEERDAEGEPTKPTSESTRLPDDEIVLRNFLHRAEVELRTMFRAPRLGDPHDTFLTDALRYLHAARDIREAKDIFKRIAKEYHSSDRSKTWDF